MPKCTLYPHTCTRPQKLTSVSHFFLLRAVGRLQLVYCLYDYARLPLFTQTAVILIGYRLVGLCQVTLIN
jgi:hypothetical protein